MSLDESILRTIDSVVDEWLKEGRIFSAFEVSLEAKKRGVQERHRNMKDYVHESIRDQDDGIYTRTLMDVGAATQAWVYHRIYDNPFDYRPLSRGDGPSTPATSSGTASPIKKLTPLANLSNNLNTGDDGVFGTDSDGNLKITRQVLSKIRVGPNMAVFIAYDPDECEAVITRAKPLGDTPFDECQSDDNGELTLTADMLAEADLNWMQAYRVEATSTEILIYENP